MEPASIVSDLLRAATLGLFVLGWTQVTTLAKEVKGIKNTVNGTGGHGERIVALEQQAKGRSTGRRDYDPKPLHGDDDE